MSGLPIVAESPFGIDNLPYGIFAPPNQPARVGVRLGDHVMDLSVVFNDDVFGAPSLNPFMARGRSSWADTRKRLTTLVREGRVPERAFHHIDNITMRLPFDIADYIDFYASEHHATNVGKLFRPDSAPLLPNWKHLPVGYHGRAGTVVVSGTDVVRPNGQRKTSQSDTPVFGPSIRLDVEAEIGFVVGVGSHLGTPIPVDDFAEHVFGVVIVNDWSARDLQAWEYVPLGPFLGKSFATSISPWVVPLAALESARMPILTQQPVLPYLQETKPWGLDIDLVIEWNGDVVSRPPYRQMYWSPAQMLAHATINGASARTGDLFASGTVSGSQRQQCGSFLELTWGGTEPVTVGGAQRTFLEDGDEIVITATAPGPNEQCVGFGEVRGRIVPAPSIPMRAP
jgi:fumarylacetoacetase